jgi:pimeloyl-ACP methyl ester carboxylesterase
VFYAPTLRGLPDLHEQWLFNHLLESGIAIAGLDVGEAYGNPVSQELFGRFAEDLAERDGFARRPCLLGRSRGGLAVAAWAASEPSRASGIAGIYPVFDLRSYPGTDKAAAAYGRTADELGAPGSIWNPVNRLDAVARGGVPAYLVHGDSDAVVPLAANSAAFAEAYRRAGRSDAVQLEVLPGQGHNFFPGFFRSPGLLRFLTERAKAGALP